MCADLVGEVVEIGFGTGLNLAHLPPSVTRLLAIDPMRHGLHLAAERLAASDIPVDSVGVDAESLELDDVSVDSALSTWTLCSVADPVAAVRELARVLVPVGRFTSSSMGWRPIRRSSNGRAASMASSEAWRAAAT